jgi:hypothetical protein
MHRLKGLPVLAGFSLLAIRLAVLGCWLIRSSPVGPASLSIAGFASIATPSSAVAQLPPLEHDAGHVLLDERRARYLERISLEKPGVCGKKRSGARHVKPSGFGYA